MYKEFLSEIKKIKVKGCIIKQNGNIVLEYYKNNKIEGELQKINSCTKSVVSALLGICLEKGLIESLDVTIDKYFSKYLRGDNNTIKREITIRHLLTMTEGLDWPEFGTQRCFSDMVKEEDMVQYILGRELIHKPGECMNYNSGASQLLAEIISMSAGTTLMEFAKRELFEPLGITEFLWLENNGHYLAGSGIKLLMKDMMKLADLYLYGGVFDGIRILSKEWINDSFVPRNKTYSEVGAYGYHWWSTNVVRKEEFIDINFAFGYGGQFIIVIPKLNMIIVIISDLKDSMLPIRLVKENVIKKEI